MTDLRSLIAQMNSRELGSIRASAEQGGVHFNWEDETLMSLLANGPEFINRDWRAKDTEAEKRFIAAANELSTMVLHHAKVEDIDRRANEMVSEQSAEYAYRLRAHARNCSEDLRARKGLLVVGEGGIGKTRFLYELAGELAKQNRDFAVSFSDQSMSELLDLDFDEVNDQFMDGFTIICDAINERDEDLSLRLIEMIPSLLAKGRISLIVSTRSGSPFSRERELEGALLCKYIFPGVNMSSLIEELSTYGDQLFFYFQDMLVGGNPRNILAAKSAIEDLSKRSSLQTAHIQRTTLIERCVKKQMAGNRRGLERWKQTKEMCKFLYSSQVSLFSDDDVKLVLGHVASEYLVDMLSSGFIRRFQLDSKEVYAFSSESQMNILVARNLHDDMDSIHVDEENLLDAASNVAKLVKRKSFGSNSHEMCQVAIDRFLSCGPEFFVELLRAFRNAELDMDELRILRETVFPEGTDFSGIRNRAVVDPGEAFLEFGGYVINPLNLVNYSNCALLAQPELLEKRFRQRWQTYNLSELIYRIKNIASYATYASSLAPTATLEWTWLSIWASSSTNSRLRIWALRLLRVLCDRSEQAIETIVGAFWSVQDVSIRRAIARTLSQSSITTKKRADVASLARSVVDDPSIIDFLIVRDMCRILGLSIVDSNGRNLYVEYADRSISEAEAEAARELSLRFDPFFDHYLPFEYLPFHEGSAQMSSLHGYLAIDKEIVREWNEQFAARLACPKPAPCAGSLVFWADANSVALIPFDKQELDSGQLYSVYICLVVDAYKASGVPDLSLLDMTGLFQSESDGGFDPAFKPILDAIGMLMGSLAANYYLDDIEIANDSGVNPGFVSDEEWAPGDEGIRVGTTIPKFNNVIDIARRKILKRVEDPRNQPHRWFDDIDGAFQSLLDVIRPISIGGVEWVPLTADVRMRISEGHDLRCSNEMMIHVASIDAPNICGIGDRNLTIETQDFKGHIADYCLCDGLLCADVPLPEYANYDSFSFAMCLPPQRLISHLDLTFDASAGIFHYRYDNEPIIICDGNPRNFMSDSVSKLTLIRRSEYTSLSNLGLIKYYAFTERFEPNNGYQNACDRHWEFLPCGTIINSFRNDGGSRLWSEEGEGCAGCYFSRAERESRRSSEAKYIAPEWLSAILAGEGQS